MREREREREEFVEIREYISVVSSVCVFVWAIGTSGKKKAKVKEKFLLVGQKALRKNVFLDLFMLLTLRL